VALSFRDLWFGAWTSSSQRVYNGAKSAVKGNFARPRAESAAAFG